MIPTPHRFALAAAFALAAIAAAAPAAAQARFVLYCSSQEEWCQLLVNEFEKKTGIRTAMTRKSSGEVYAQIKAEKDNPRADAWWGGTGDPHLQAAEERLTLAHEPAVLKELHPWAVKLWETSGKRAVGIYSGAIGFGFNSELLAKKGLTEPKCWADLVKPEFKGEVQVANPHSSGTAYTLVATMVQLWGDNGGFDWLKKLNVNVNQYTKSGSAPIVAAARGETLIGIAFMDDIVTQKIKGFPVVVVAPCEGTGYEIGAMSIIEGARNLDSAKRWYDWVLSAEAQEIGIKAGISYQTPSNRAAAPAPQGPKLSEVKLIDYDFKKLGSAEERRRLLARWDSEIKINP